MAEQNKPMVLILNGSLRGADGNTGWLCAEAARQLQGRAQVERITVAEGCFDLEALEAAVVTCWASARSERVTAYRAQGFGTAIDDFGSGYAGLGLLVEFQPDEIKIDMTLLRGIDADPVRRAVVAGIVTTARELGIRLIAEGVETTAEFAVLSGMGIDRYQGFLFARPGFNTLATAADINWP